LGNERGWGSFRAALSQRAVMDVTAQARTCA
jgi:hypothetical protein